MAAVDATLDAAGSHRLIPRVTREESAIFDRIGSFPHGSEIVQNPYPGLKLPGLAATFK